MKQMTYTHIDPHTVLNAKDKTEPRALPFSSWVCFLGKRFSQREVLIGPLKCYWHSLIFGNNGKGQIRT